MFSRLMEFRPLLFCKIFLKKLGQKGSNLWLKRVIPYELQDLLQKVGHLLWAYNLLYIIVPHIYWKVHVFFSIIFSYKNHDILSIKNQRARNIVYSPQFLGSLFIQQFGVNTSFCIIRCTIKLFIIRFSTFYNSFNDFFAIKVEGNSLF